MVTERVSGTDGKSYRAKKLTDEQRKSLVWWVHHLHHDEHLSQRRIVAAMADLNGIHLSAGTVHNYLNRWHCHQCQD